MTVALIAALTVTVLAFAWLLDRKDTRNANIITAKDARLSEETAAHRREVADLLQRIQAPQAAVIRHDVDRAAEQNLDLPQPPASDEEWEQAEEERAALARLEELENAPFDRA